MGEQLAGWGKVAIVETVGRTSGAPVRAAVGYVEDPDGTLLVSAGSWDAGWAQNLLANPACGVTIGERVIPAIAESLDGPDHARALRELILKYGTPAERLGGGPTFRLRPVVGASRR